MLSMQPVSAPPADGCFAPESRCKVNDGADVNVAVEVLVKVIVEDKGRISGIGSRPFSSPPLQRPATLRQVGRSLILLHHAITCGCLAKRSLAGVFIAYST